MKNRIDVRAFREAHGDPETWDAVDFEVHENLTLIAQAENSRRAAVLTRRAKALVAVAYMAPLYALAEVVHAVRGADWHRLECHLDRVDDRLTAAEAACLAGGDTGFVEWLGNTTDHWTDTVSALTARLVREPVR
jgi:hypothetical protein